jgi:uncharacterized SAM-binding protein YcdF (DUF218 family)
MKLAKTGRVVGWSLAALLALVGLIVVIVTVTPLTRMWASRLAAPWSDDNGDVLIILAGDKIDTGVIGLNSYWRCFYGSLAWREGGFRQILITGDSVVVPMKTFLIAMGVPEGAIEVEAQSVSTYENAIHSFPLLAGMPGKKVVLTSDYHMWRARRTFRKAGIVTGFRTVPDVTKRSAGWRGRWPAFLDLLNESLKIGYYEFKGWV